MNLNLDLGTVDWKNLRPQRRALTIFAAILLVAAALWGTWYYINHPQKPWLVRWHLDRYLSKHGKSSDFKVKFDFPSKSEMSRPGTPGGPAKGTRTGKSFEALQDEYCGLKIVVVRLENRAEAAPEEIRQGKARIERLEKQLAAAKAANSTNVLILESNLTVLRVRVAALPTAEKLLADAQQKEKQIEPIAADLWEIQRKWAATGSGPEVNPAILAKARNQFVNEIDQKIGTAESYAAIYRLLGQELWVADELLESRNVDHRREGVQVAMAACRQALNSAINGWVAARICEGYILPNLDVADETDARSPLHIDRLISYCADVYRRNNEYEGAASVFEISLERAAAEKDSRRADRARWEIAQAYEQGGDPARALTYLKQVQNTNDRGLTRRIAWLERQVKQN